LLQNHGPAAASDFETSSALYQQKACQVLFYRGKLFVFSYGKAREQGCGANRAGFTLSAGLFRRFKGIFLKLSFDCPT
jgi:hypothetical protein